MVYLRQEELQIYSSNLKRHFFFTKLAFTHLYLFSAMNLPNLFCKFKTVVYQINSHSGITLETYYNSFSLVVHPSLKYTAHTNYYDADCIIALAVMANAPKPHGLGATVDRIISRGLYSPLFNFA